MQLARRQVALGDDVTVFGNTHADRALPEGVRPRHYDVIDFHAASSVSDKLKSVREVMWSSRATEAMSETIETFQPDVVHLHNYSHQLSSSIIPAIRRYGVRSVATAHDYKLICPAYVAKRKDADCFACSHRLSLKLLRDRCHHGSLPWSALVAGEAALVRSMRLTPDALIAPSQFMSDAIRDSWAGGSPIETIRNPAEASGLDWHGGDYLLYVGRLSREKGVESLIEACVERGISLVVAGEGPLRSRLEQLATGADIRFVGHVSLSELGILRASCMAQAVPSEWPENAPLSALEAAIDGVPLITSRRGGLPEFKQIGARVAFVDSFTGESLSAAITSLQNEQGDLASLRDELSWGRHLTSVYKVYKGSR